MNRGLLRRSGTQRLVDNGRAEPALTVVGKPASILPWPGQPDEIRHQETVVAELRTKRMSDGSVATEQFTATIPVSMRSPHAILYALAQACAGNPDLRWSIGSDEHVILDIRVRA